MTAIKLLSAGMIAAAMLATPAMARDHTAKRHSTESANVSDPAADRYVDGQVCVPAPRVGAFATEPWGGGNIPCEPGSY